MTRVLADYSEHEPIFIKDLDEFDELKPYRLTAKNIRAAAELGIIPIFKDERREAVSKAGIRHFCIWYKKKKLEEAEGLIIPE